MQPIVHTAAQLRVLAACCHDTNPGTWSIAWRADDVIASDGAMAVSLPLPHDPDRLFAIRAGCIEEWVDGFRVSEIEDDLFGGEPEIYSPRFEIRVDGPRVLILPFPVLESGAQLVVPIEDVPAHYRPGGAADDALALHSVTEPPRISALYLAKLGDVYEAFSVALINEDGPTRNGIGILSAPGGTKPIVFTFVTEHGDARVAIMGLRNPREASGARSR